MDEDHDDDDDDEEEEEDEYEYDGDDDDGDGDDCGLIDFFWGGWGHFYRLARHRSQDVHVFHVTLIDTHTHTHVKVLDIGVIIRYLSLQN